VYVYLFSIVFTLSLPCYGLDDQLGKRKKNVRLRAQQAAETAEEKLEKRMKKTGQDGDIDEQVCNNSKNNNDKATKESMARRKVNG